MDMKRWTWAILTACVVIAIVATEVALRSIGLGDPPIAILDEELEYRLVPSATYERWGNRIEIGDHGFRARSLPEAIGEAEVRLLLIGDSVVYGNHFLDQHETISLRLSAMLSSPTCTVNVIPMAVSSWGPVNQAAALSRHGTFGAREAFIVLSSHDIFDTPVPNGSLVPYRLSSPLGAIGDAVEAIFERYLPRSRPGAPLPFEGRQAASLAALDEIAEMIAVSGSELSLVYNATTLERRSGTSDQGRRLLDWAQARGVASLDLGTVSDIGYRDHIHPNSAGAQRIAEALAGWYSERLSCGGA